MGSPAHTALGTPDGIMLHTGWPARIVFAALPDADFQVKSITPPAIQGGDPINTSNNHRATWRTKRPRSLKELGDLTFVAAYDANFYDEVASTLTNYEGSISYYFPDGSYLDFFGFLYNSEFSEMSEDSEEPNATGQIAISNWDPANSVEASPVFVSVSGS